MAFLLKIGLLLQELIYKTKRLKINKKDVKLQIWVVAGQDNFKNMNKVYYKGCQGVFIFYDITNLDSFENLDGWLEDFESYNNNKCMCKYLIGDKCDLEDQRKISFEEGKKYA